MSRQEIVIKIFEMLACFSPAAINQSKKILQFIGFRNKTFVIYCGYVVDFVAKCSHFELKIFNRIINFNLMCFFDQDYPHYDQPLKCYAYTQTITELVKIMSNFR